MKKLFAGVLFVTLMTAGAATVFAGGHGHGRNCGNGSAVSAVSSTYYSGSGQGRYYVDADNDGICDNCGAEDGKCFCGRNYVDVDNDGVCDNYGSGSGQGCHGGQGNGCRGGRNR